MKITFFAVLGLSCFGPVKGEKKFRVEEVNGKLCTDRSLPSDLQCCKSGCGGIDTKLASFSGNATIGISSCNGDSRTCQHLALNNGQAIVGENSCVGSGACHVGGNALGWFEAGEWSCRGNRYTCDGAGTDNGYFKVGDHSCIGSGAGVCTYIGKRGYAVIGDYSCTLNGSQGDNCQSLGSNGKVTVGNHSCVGHSACFLTGTDHEVVIGDNSCHGSHTCREMMRSVEGPQMQKMEIGSNACNCDDCCRCLSNSAIRKVPDGKCNAMGSGPDNCCVNRNTVNTIFNETGTASSPSPPGLASLAEIITAPPEYNVSLNSCAFNSTGKPDIGDITCTFTTLGGVDYSVSSVLYNADCSSAGAPTGVSQDTSSFFSPSLISGSSTQQSSTYAVTISLANSAAPADSEFIAFCLKTEVKDRAGFVYDWIGQKIQLDVSTDGTFSTSGLTTEKYEGNTDEATDAGDADFGVSAWRCDSNGDAVSDTQLSLGENFFLCVEGGQSAVLVNSIGELKATKEGVIELGLVTKDGDGKAEGTRNPNTFVYGYGTNKVVIATRLPSPFFTAAGGVTLTGTANISTGGRRRLVRMMQEAPASASLEQQESADFSMEVDIVGSPGASGAAAIKGTASTVLLGAVAAGLFV